MSETSWEPSFICRIRVRSERRVASDRVAEKSRSRMAAMSSSKAADCSGSRTRAEKAENVRPSSEDSMRSTPRKTSSRTWDWESSAARIDPQLLVEFLEPGAHPGEVGRQALRLL